jgi:hypothetical protein
MKVVKFLQDHSPYVKGKVCSFSDYDADVRINAAVCEELKLYDRQPDQRITDNVDENGRLTKFEVRQVPDDLNREADLPLIEAGGRPKDEAHMTEAEKKRRLQDRKAAEPETRSMDASAVSKMVSRPVAKK